MRKAIITFLLLASVGFCDTFTSHLKPDATNTLDIGTSSLIWRRAYIDRIYARELTLSSDLDLGGNNIIGVTNLTISGVFTDGNYTFDTDGNVSGLGTVGCGDITVDADLVLSEGSITSVSGAITFVNENLITSGIVQASDFAKTGWPTTSGVTLSFVGGTTRTFTVTDGGSAYYYIDGVKYTLGGNKTVVIDDLEGPWYIYFDGATLTASQTIWSFTGEDKALVSFLYWARDVGTPANGKAIIVGWELHSFHMGGATHARLHYAGGARWETGLLVSDATGELINVSAGDFWDEDLNIPITDDDTPTALFEQILSPAELPVYYRDGASAWRIYETTDKANATDAGYVDGSNDLKYNKLNGTWANATVGLNNYVAYWVVATNEQTEPVALIMGQRVDNKLSEAKVNNVFSGLSLTGLPFQEMVVLARLILKDTATYTLEEVLDLRAYNIKGNITSPLITQHAGLGGLEWSAAGHTIDTDVDFEGYDLLQVTDIGTTADADLIQLASGAVTINGTIGAGATTVDSLICTNGATFDTDTLVVDAVNHRVGIEVAAPLAPLEVGDANPTVPSIVTDANRNSILLGGKDKACVYIEGANQASVILEDSGGSVNRKVVQLIHAADEVEFRTITDAGAVGRTLISIYNGSESPGLAVGMSASSGVLDIARERNLSNIVYTMARLRYRTTGTPAAGIGAAFSLRAENSTGEDANTGYFAGRLLNVVNGSEQGEMLISPDWQDSESLSLDRTFRVKAVASDEIEVTMTKGVFKLSYDATNYATFATGSDGDLTITTVDADGTAGHINFVPNGNVGINEAAPQDTLEVNGTILVKDKLKFTQDDGLEYIDSLNDGYMDYGATTGHRLLIGGTEQVNLIDGVFGPKTDSDVDLGTTGARFKDLYIDSITSGGAGTFDTVDATTDFTIGDTIITDGVITDATGLSIVADTVINGTLLATDKIAFTQVDLNEYIDSLGDGYLDLVATSGIRFWALGSGTPELQIGTDVVFPFADSSVDLGTTTKRFKDFYVDSITTAGNLDDGTYSATVAETLTSTVSFVVSGGSSAVTTGLKGFIEIPISGKLIGWTLLADQSGAIKIDVWKDTYANFPPIDGDSITNGHEPEIAASGIKAQDLDIADWSGEDAVAAGDVLAFNVDSCTSITQCTISLRFVKDDI